MSFTKRERERKNRRDVKKRRRGGEREKALNNQTRREKVGRERGKH